MSAAFLAYIFLLHLPHTNRCYPHSATSQNCFVFFWFKYLSKRKKQNYKVGHDEKKGLIVMK